MTTDGPCVIASRGSTNYLIEAACSDLKPANILVTDGRAKLLDFGVARLRAKAGADDTVTVAGAVAGTPAYMVPEHAQGKPPDERSDIFSFGAVLSASVVHPPIVRLLR